MDTSLYETLEVSRGSGDSEIKRAYHRLARQYHPDKNPGYEDRFKDIQFAYEVLSDPQKRELYDRFGLDAVKNDGGGGSGMHDDISEMFFGGGGIPGMHGGGLFSHLFGGGGEQRKSRPKAIGVPLEVTLEELYNGAIKQVEYHRKVLCDACSGSGSKTGVNIKCRKCRGSGMTVSHRSIGPGMVQQIREHCGDCGGTGDYVKDKDRCKTCKGKRVCDEDAKLDVPVIPGMEDEARIPFHGEGNQEPEVDAGDLIVVLQVKEHEVFQREGLDLFINKDISLVEALCGLTFVVDHLDGQKLAVQKAPGEVIFPGCIKGIREKGMPKFRPNELKHWVSECQKGRHPTNFSPPDFYGNLYFKFNVIFPESEFISDEDDIKALMSLLPRKPMEAKTSDDDMVVSLMNYDDTRGAGGGEEGREFDEEDMHDGGGGVRCAQQ